jgi:hypothetical protein
MQNFNSRIEQVGQDFENSEREKIMEEFYRKFFDTQVDRVRKISLDDLKELKEKGITTEQFLDYLCQSHGFLLHGSIYDIKDNKLKSSGNKVYASDKAAIAIMRSIYSNENVNLSYSYTINEQRPLALKVHTPPDGKFIKVDRGFIYVIDGAGFKNEPNGSWQFVKENDEVEFNTVIETEESDFKYPVEVSNDLGRKKEKPEILYHASKVSGITELTPQIGIHMRDRSDGEVIFSTPDKGFASAFLAENRGSRFMKIGFFRDILVVIINADREEFIKKDTGGSVYSFSSDTFDYDPNKGMGDKEWTSKESVRPLSEVRYNSTLDAMIEGGAQVYFVDERVFNDIKKAPKNGYDIITGLTSENERINKNVKSLKDSGRK